MTTQQSLLLRAVMSSDGSGSFVPRMSSRRPENAHSRFGCGAAIGSLTARAQFSTTPLTLLSEPSGLPPITLSNIDPSYYGPGFKGAIGAAAVARQ
jgi:hypothetical protein